MFIWNQTISRRNIGTLVNSSEPFRYNFETWSDILVSKYSTPYESVKESFSFEIDEIENKLHLIFPN